MGTSDGLSINFTGFLIGFPITWHCTARRRTVLSVLSKRWAGLLQAPGPAWADVVINTAAEFPPGARLDSQSMMAWFSRREGSIIVLEVAGDMQRLPAAVIETIYLSQVGRNLLPLRIEGGSLGWTSFADV